MSDLTQRIAQLSTEDRIRLEERLLAAHKNGNSQRIPRRADTGPVPLSFTQERLWFLAQLEPDSSAYNEATVIRLRGPLDVLALERSLDALSERHDSLRVCFREIDDSVMQVAEPLPSTHIDIFDFTSVPEEAQMDAVWQKVDSVRSVIFDLTAPPLWRLFLIRLADDDHIVVRITHHIISDGWSSTIFWRELRHFYAAYVGGNEPTPLPELPVSYADFSVWQRENLRGERLTGLVEYWRERLAGIEPLNLPTDHPRPAQPSHRGALLEFKLDGELSDSLSALARESGASLYMLLLAAFQTLLHRYSGQDDIVVGSPIANRSRPELEGIYGFFANTLVLRADCGGNPTFRSLLAQARQNALSAYQHQDLPFEKLVEELHPVRDMSRSPIVDVLFALQNVPRSALGLAGTVMHRLDRTTSTSKFDLSLFLQERDGDLNGRVEYATDLFDAATIQRLVGHFHTLLQGIVADPDCPIGELPLLAEAERRQILVEWNQTSTDYPPQKTIHQLFHEQAERTPDAVAIVDGERQLTYREVEETANRLAHHLRSLDVQPGQPVGLYVERSASALLTILAILKVGAAYVPLDLRSPPSRLQGAIEETGIRFLFTETAVPAGLEAKSIELLSFALLAQELVNYPVSPPDISSAPDDLAYVMYTSGSTGRPKGVAVPHRAVVRLVQSPDFISISERDIFLLLSPLSFDASTLELWGSLLHGAKLVVVPERTPTLSTIVSMIQRHGASVLWLTAALFHLLADEFPEVMAQVRCLLAGGDVLDPKRVRAVVERMAAGSALVNGYGPTENTTFSCCFPITDPKQISTTVPIGRPIRGSTAFILDNQLQPVPIGVTGELYVGGAGLALGYFNRPDLTAERFVPHPFSNEPGARLYRTGDLARYREDGVIEFLGRVDRQVKIRGFRVELGEIEAVLRDHPAVRDGVAGVLDDEKLGKRLVVWWMGKPEATAGVDELRYFLRQRLPDYMLPVAFIQVDALPLTPNGKIDIRALPDPADHHQPGHMSQRQAESALEQQLLHIWESVLGRRGIGVEDNFFDLGGHSLLAVRLMAKVAKITGRELPVASLFHGPTVRQQALLLADEGWTPPWVSLVPVQPGGSRPPLFLVPPVAGTAIRFASLSNFLGAEQPIYSFDPLGFDGKFEPLGTVEEIAAQYIEEMRYIQPTGPYLLGGMCFGAHVAFEMAQQLQASGEDAPVVLTFDAGQPTNGPTWKRPKRSLSYYTHRLVEHLKNDELSQGVARYLRFRIRTIRVRFRHLFLPHGGAKDRVWFAHLRAQMTYQAKPFLGQVILFQSEQYFRRTLQTRWKDLAVRGLEIIHFPNTTHRSLLLEDENVERIADKLREVVDRWMAEHWQDSSQ